MKTFCITMLILCMAPLLHAQTHYVVNFEPARHVLGSEVATGLTNGISDVDIPFTTRPIVASVNDSKVAQFRTENGNQEIRFDLDTEQENINLAMRVSAESLQLSLFVIELDISGSLNQYLFSPQGLTFRNATNPFEEVIARNAVLDTSNALIEVDYTSSTDTLALRINGTTLDIQTGTVTPTILRPSGFAVNNVSISLNRLNLLATDVVNLDNVIISSPGTIPDIFTTRNQIFSSNANRGWQRVVFRSDNIDLRNSDTYRYRGSRGSSRYAVQYFQRTGGIRNVTASMITNSLTETVAARSRGSNFELRSRPLAIAIRNRTGTNYRLTTTSIRSVGNRQQSELIAHRIR